MLTFIVACLDFSNFLVEDTTEELRGGRIFSAFLSSEIQIAGKATLAYIGVGGRPPWVCNRALVIPDPLAIVLTILQLLPFRGLVRAPDSHRFDTPERRCSLGYQSNVHLQAITGPINQPDWVN